MNSEIEVEEEDAYYEDDDYSYYYCNDEEFGDELMDGSIEKGRKNIEFFDYECISVEQAQLFINAKIESLSSAINMLPSITKLLLIQSKWNEEEIVANFKTNVNYFLEAKGIKPSNKSLTSGSDAKALGINSLEELSYLKCATANSNLTGDLSLNLTKKLLCNVCLHSSFINNHKALSCEHYYCQECWKCYLEHHINMGHATTIQCMSTDCNILVPEHFIESFFSANSNILERYSKLCFRDCIDSNPYLFACIGRNCPTIIKAKESKAKRVVCTFCNSSYCFKCGCEYHAPTDCKTIKLWFNKCADDSETANYIAAHTKDCPDCGSSIEKAGGCNHMKCYSCKYEFCWMCLGSWKSHSNSYYDCSRYREQPKMVSDETEMAREALKRYLFYYERWDNHMRSLRLEDKALEHIKEIINEKVMSNTGTWIDWQYLLDAAALLAKCRYTLQYTYPYAYYMESGPNKSLFEYQQAKLEAEIENLSWKIEHAETTNRGEVENQMDIVEKRRTTLLEDFFI